MVLGSVYNCRTETKGGPAGMESEDAPVIGGKATVEAEKQSAVCS